VSTRRCGTVYGWVGNCFFSEHFLIGLECGVLRVVLQFWILFPLFILVYNFLVILLGCFGFTIVNII
jgi:hypothetical protein